VSPITRTCAERPCRRSFSLEAFYARLRADRKDPNARCAECGTLRCTSIWSDAVRRRHEATNRWLTLDWNRGG